MEDKIISAVRTVASSINSGSKVVSDLSELIEVTSQLPLSSFDYWERFIRSEESSAAEGMVEAQEFNYLARSN